MLTMPKCHDCGKFCRPVEWQMIYSGALPEPQEEIYKCAACAEKHGSFVPQHGIKPECSCGNLTHNDVTETPEQIMQMINGTAVKPKVWA